MRRTRRAMLRRTLAALAASLVGTHTAGAASAQPPGHSRYPLSAYPLIRSQSAVPPSLTSPQPIVAPLQPVRLQAIVPGYSGPVAVVLFDFRRRFAGSAEGHVASGQGEVEVLPRGALGPQWAALFAGGQQVAANPALFTLEAHTTVQAGQPRFDQFVPKARELLGSAVLEYTLQDGRTRARGYRSSDSPLVWLRDHVHAQRGARYLDADLRLTLDLFRDAQAPDGSFPDFLARPHVAPQAYRTPVEADVEYLYVQGVYECWQACGDDAWLRGHLGAMRRAITYTLQHPQRWDAQRGLVKRPFTIDTWDFEVGPTIPHPITGEPSPRHWIDERTIWGVFHGDNTGTAQALRMLARVEERVGDGQLAGAWRELADGLVRNLTALAWNGRFFRHHVPARPLDLPGVDEAAQLSLSNACALNRGVLSAQQAQAILDEYIRRSKTTHAFAEWFSIDPPFPPGSIGLAGRSGEQPGTYVNGGIMPLVGGELARGAFRHGNESYGFAILDHYWQRMLSRGRTFLWYRPDGAEGVGSDQTVPYDAWGAGAMLCALIEGAAGIEDAGAAMREVTISPRWPAAGVASAYAVARYPAGDGYTAYAWSAGPGALNLQATGSADRSRLRLLLPPEARGAVRATLNGNPATAAIETVRASRYAVLETTGPIVNVQVRW
ncbi:MAG TPA: hypothetical protein VNL77_12410 [Roseiflexaceae bacterium]|nr:hypothetical protein [Roseiflexaceae bacterium]